MQSSTNFIRYMRDDKKVLGPLYFGLRENENLTITFQYNLPSKPISVHAFLSLQKRRPFPGPPSTRLLPLWSLIASILCSTKMGFQFWEQIEVKRSHIRRRRMSNPHSVAIVMTTCEMWAGALSCKSRTLQKVSEYDQEIPQSQTADQPKAPLGRATGHLK